MGTVAHYACLDGDIACHIRDSGSTSRCNTNYSSCKLVCSGNLTQDGEVLHRSAITFLGQTSVVGGGVDVEGDAVVVTVEDVVELVQHLVLGEVLDVCEQLGIQSLALVDESSIVNHLRIAGNHAGSIYDFRTQAHVLQFGHSLGFLG